MPTHLKLESTHTIHQELKLIFLPATHSSYLNGYTCDHILIQKLNASLDKKFISHLFPYRIKNRSIQFQTTVFFLKGRIITINISCNKYCFAYFTALESYYLAEIKQLFVSEANLNHKLCKME